MKTCLLIFLFVFTTNIFADDKVYIKVGDANIKRSLLALTPLQFYGSPAIYPAYQKVGQDLYSTIYNDLDVSSYFTFVSASAFLEDPLKVGLKPNTQDKENGFDFAKWSAINTEFLVKSGFRFEGDTVEVTAFVYHVPTNKLVFGKEYKNTKGFVNKIAHRLANDVLEYLTGKRGMFESRVVLSSDRGGNQHKEIFIMDWDGNNVTQLTDHKTISISPTWSPDNKKIAYTSFAWHAKWNSRNADLFLFDIKSGTRKVLSSYKGINSGAAFTAEGDILLTVSKTEGIPDIFRINQEGKVLEQLTTGPTRAMNVEPAVSPDDQRVAFSSDRSGRPMIYVMDLKAKKRNPMRVVFSGWYNSTPTWSPDSKRIAFAGFDKDLKHFDIFLMDADGHNLSRLTTAKKFRDDKYSNNEDPTFSPDGRHVMFISDRTGKKQVYIVNVDGSNERRITFDRFNYYKPKWSTNID